MAHFLGRQVLPHLTALFLWLRAALSRLLYFLRGGSTYTFAFTRVEIRMVSVAAVDRPAVRSVG